MDDNRDLDQQRHAEDLPAHERDDDVEGVMGAGVLGAGGTAADRGTGELTGTAQGSGAGEDEGDDPFVPGVGSVIDPRLSGGSGGGGGIPGLSGEVDDRR